MKELKYTKNSKFEIVFENLNEVKEDNKAMLRLKNGDITPLIKAYNETTSGFHFCIPYLAETLSVFNALFNIRFDNTYSMINCSVFGCYNEDHIYENTTKNIFPKWNIPKKSTVLFFNRYLYKTYEMMGYCSGNYVFGYLIEEELTDMDEDTFPFCLAGYCDESLLHHEKISIILPELHAEDKLSQCHIDNVNKFCKDFKEKCKIKEIYIYSTHCFDYLVMNKISKQYINKITTTNSTGVLEVQKSDKLEVVDVVEFFKD